MYDNLIPLKRAEEGSLSAPLVRMSLDLLIAGVALYTFQNRHKWPNAPLVGRIAQIGGIGSLLLGIGEVYIAATPHKKTESSAPMPPLKAYYKLRIEDLEGGHPYDRTTPDLQGRSRLATTGIVSPAKETLETYDEWFGQAKILGLKEGSFYYYQTSDKTYKLHILTSQGKVVEEQECNDFEDLQTWLQTLASTYAITTITPINYALLIDMQNHIIQKFGGKGKSSDTAFLEPTIGIDSVKISNHNLFEQPLHRTFTLRGIHQGVSREYTIYLSPYSVWLKEQDNLEEICDLSLAEDLVTLQIAVTNMVDSIIDTICTKLEPTLRHISPPSTDIKYITWTRKQLEKTNKVQKLIKKIEQQWSIESTEQKEKK